MEGTGRIRFGDYEFDRQGCELRRDGQRVPLQIQPFAVLAALLERPGSVVTRAELRAKIWPSTVYVDFNHGLNNAVTRLRQALHESADAPQYIETLPRVGYRFIHALEVRESDPGPPAAASRAPMRRFSIAAAGALLVVAAGAGLAYWSALGADATADRRPTDNAEAYDAYLRGLESFERRSKESTRLSIQFLERAIEADTEFAEAYASLAMAYTLAGGNTLVKFMSNDEAHLPALAAARRALELDPDLARAHLALAGVLNQLQPWAPATDLAIEQAYRRALDLDPEDASARLFYGNFLSTRSRGGEAVVQYRVAIALDPLSPSINSRLGMELIALGMTADGLDYLRRTVELDPWQFNAHVRLGWGYLALGELDAAELAFGSAERISPNSARSQAGLAFVAARQGDTERAHALLRDVIPLAESIGDPFEVAIVYVGLQDRENSITWLAKTARETRTLHRTGPWGIGAPIYDWLRSDARFAEIERNITAASVPGPPTERSL